MFSGQAPAPPRWAKGRGPGWSRKGQALGGTDPDATVGRVSSRAVSDGGPDGLYVLASGPAGDLPIVLVHGGLDRSASFGRMARRLGDIPLLRYDRRGYGRSAGVPVGPLPVHVDDLLGLLDQPSVVFGHSVGGVVALAAAQRRPDRVSAVVAYEPPLPWLDWWPRDGDALDDPGDEAERFMRRMVGDRIWERLPAATRQARREEGPALRADIDSLERGGPAFDPASIAVPVIVAHGSETTWWHRRAVEELAATIPGAVRREVSEASHGIHLSHPREAAELAIAGRAAARAGRSEGTHREA